MLENEEIYYPIHVELWEYWINLSLMVFSHVNSSSLKLAQKFAWVNKSIGKAQFVQICSAEQHLIQFPVKTFRSFSLSLLMLLSQWPSTDCITYTWWDSPHFLIECRINIYWPKEIMSEWKSKVDQHYRFSTRKRVHLPWICVSLWDDNSALGIIWERAKFIAMQPIGNSNEMPNTEIPLF